MENFAIFISGLFVVPSIFLLCMRKRLQIRSFPASVFKSYLAISVVLGLTIIVVATCGLERSLETPYLFWLLVWNLVSAILNLTVPSRLSLMPCVYVVAYAIYTFLAYCTLDKSAGAIPMPNIKLLCFGTCVVVAAALNFKIVVQTSKLD